MNWRDEVWFFDTEVLPHDWLFCATNKEKRVTIHNDNTMLREFLETERPFLCGYNCKHYDIYIIKAILAGGTPEDVKAVNDAILVDGMQGWEIDMGWVKLPQSFDLMLDLPTRPSLKMIEGNLKMDIRESEVDFNTEYPTKEQWQELEEYCWHDVEALIPLYKAREDYLNAKETLAEMKGLNVKSALNMTNAKLTALFLGAQRVERDDEREYVYPENVDMSLMPQEVIDFFNRLPEGEIPLDILFGQEGVPDEDGKVVKSRNPYRSLSIDIADCPHVLGWGGLHGALVNYSEVTTDERIILNYDASSFYPSIMVKNGYLSRNVPEPKDFENVLKMRLEAKRTGDMKTSDALKLVANTSFGCSNNKYNDMYDPLMAHSICISGQLYLVNLILLLWNTFSSFTLIQSNTDGIMFSIRKDDVVNVRRVIETWERVTGFEMEEKGIEVVVQRDVNNYVMRELGGKIKVKGGVVSDYKGGSFKHNSLSVVCRAIVENLLDGVPIEETINNEQDPFAFQMITKAGGTYEKVVHVNGFGEVEVNRTNRVYAGKDERLGAVYKIKADGRRDRIANCPKHAIVDNSGILGVDKIDKQWYIDLATKRRDEFLGIKPKRKKRSKK